MLLNAGKNAKAQARAARELRFLCIFGASCSAALLSSLAACASIVQCAACSRGARCRRGLVCRSAMSGGKSVTVCKRALRGLFAGRTVRHGNNVSEDGGNKCVLACCATPPRAPCLTQRLRRHRTRRIWRPNAQRKRVYSELLGRMIPLTVTTHALRCIDKAGGASRGTSAALPRALGLTPPPPRLLSARLSGLDRYILNAKPEELGTGIGLRLRAALGMTKQLTAEANRLRAASEAADAAADAPPHAGKSP